jgi:hypothetical protein
MSRDYESIFDRESDLLGRPLNWRDKIRVSSKYIAIIGFFVAISFWLLSYWEVSRTYDEPKIFLLENIAFEVGRAPRGAETRVSFNNGMQKFTSTCIGLDEFVCGTKYFWRLRVATLIQFIETSPNKGVIKKIVISDSSGNREFTNLEVNNYIKNFSKDTYRRNWVSLFIPTIAGTLYFLLTVIHRKNHKGE